MRLTDHPAARSELLAATQYYQRISRRLAARFVAEITRTLNLIQQRPESRRFVAPDARGYRLAAFPYTILYQVNSDIIEVVAYKHDRRHPNYWRDRLTD